MLPLLLALALQVPSGRELRDASFRGGRFLRAAEGGDPELRLFGLAAGDHAPTRELLATVLASPPTDVRSAALQARALARLDPWMQRPRIAHCIQLILDAQTEDGLWSEGHPVEEPQVFVVARPRNAVLTFDSRPPAQPLLKLAPWDRAEGRGAPTHAAWAGFGLKALGDAKIEVPKEVFQRAADAWAGEGLDAVDVVAWRSAFLHWAGGDFRKDAVVAAALERLKSAPFPTSPREFARLHVALMHLGLDKLGDRDWYAEGAVALLASQKEDGSWGDLESTAWAISVLPGWPPGIPRNR